MDETARELSEAKRVAFDALASRWNSLKPESAAAAGLDIGFALLGSVAGLSIVDLGCGTGRLEKHILPRLGHGSIAAVDFSAAMIAEGSRSCQDPRVTWLCKDVRDTGLPSSSADAVLCFDSFPHFPDHRAVFAEISRWLRPFGVCLIWHDIGRQTLAEVHHRAGPHMMHDVLPPVSDLADLCVEAGFVVERATEDDSSYILFARKRG